MAWPVALSGFGQREVEGEDFPRVYCLALHELNQISEVPPDVGGAAEQVYFSVEGFFAGHGDTVGAADASDVPAGSGSSG